MTMFKQYALYTLIWIIVGSIDYFIYRQIGGTHIFILLIAPFFGLLATDAVRIHYQEKRAKK